MTRQGVPGSCCSSWKRTVTQCWTASCRYQQSRRVIWSEMLPRSKAGNWTNGFGKVAWRCAVETAVTRPKRGSLFMDLQVDFGKLLTCLWLPTGDHYHIRVHLVLKLEIRCGQVGKSVANLVNDHDQVANTLWLTSLVAKTCTKQRQSPMRGPCSFFLSA